MRHLAVAVLVTIGCGNSENAAAPIDASVDTTVASADGAAPFEAGFTPDADATEQDASDGGCDPARSPRDLPCRMNDATGLYVSATSGVDGGAGVGTRARPFATIGAAVAAIDAAHKNVYICAGTYPENVVINVDGVGMYGNFDCATWAADDSDAAAAQTKVAPTSGYALHVGAVHGAHFERVEFDGPDGKGPGESSIAVFVSGASGVEFRGVTMVAGVGRDGDAGAAGVNWSGGAAPDGNDANGADGGAEQRCVGICMNSLAGGQSIGGTGGHGSPTSPSGGAPGLPSIPGGVPDGGGGFGFCVSGGVGQNGAAGPPGNGGGGASQCGAIEDGGWSAAQSAPGAPGQAGQGGGGGSGETSASNGGGAGGGCGGCGGGGGLAGQSGGSSFGLLVHQAGASLDTCTVVANAAGNGGHGGNGQGGQAPGSGGGSAPAGCSAGSGGTGGQGGGGGGGAAGISAAIAYKGAAPTLTNGTTVSASTTPATPGAPGAGGSPPATRGADPPDGGAILMLP